MSLLMQALKRAEQAKKNTTVTDTSPATSATYPPLNHTATPAPEPATEPAVPPARVEPEPAKPAMQLSLADEDVPAAVTPAPVTPAPAVRVDAPAPPPVMSLQDLIPTPGGPRQSVDAAMQSQHQAHAHLMAKQTDRPKRRFSMLAAAVFAFMLCCAGAFYYWQLMQPDLIVPAQIHHATLPAATVTPTAETPATPTAVTADTVTVPARKPEPRASEQQATKPIASTSKPQPENRIRQAAQQADTEQIRIQKSELPNKINATLTEAYQLYTSGRKSAARPLYEEVLREEPNNRDALLGLAAIELSQHHTEQAAARYSRLLDLDPTDADAIAGLTSLRSDNQDQSESQLKKVLTRNPQSAATLFELGNLYGRQSRWSEAQDMYFRAFTITPKNADYAFNLAVSLDRLGQTRLALDFYQQALKLSGASPGNFSQAAASDRIAQLQSVNR